MRFLISLLFTIIFSGSIVAQYVPGTSYYGVNNYIEYIAGDMPIIIVAPHAGSLEPAFLPDINTRGADNGTMELALFMADSLYFKSGGYRPHIIINHLRPNKLNPVHSEADSILSAGTHPIALQALNDFYRFIQVAYNKVTDDWGKGHYFELHGNGTDEQWNMIGLGVSKTYLNMPDSVLKTYVNNSTIKNLCTVGGADFLEVLKGPTSLGGMLNSLGWKSTPSPTYPAPPLSVTFFYAGQNTWRYGSKHGGTIDATHLESYWKFMVKSYNRSKYFNDLADAILNFMNIHYGFSFNSALINEPISYPKTKIFPNPIKANTELTIERQDKIEKILIFNSVGQLCWSQIGDHSKLTIDLQPGVYILIISNPNGKTEHQKLIVQ